MMDSIFIFLILASVVIYLIYVGRKLLLRNNSSTDSSLQDAIDEQTNALRRAQTALENSGKLVRQCEQDVASSEADVNILTARVKSALKEKDEEKARKHVIRLQKEEKELDVKEENLREAMETHQFYADAVQNEREALEERRREAERLEVRLELAEADKAYRATSDIGDKAEDLKRKVRVAEVGVKAARPTKDEFTQAGDDLAIDARLAKFNENLEEE